MFNDIHKLNNQLSALRDELIYGEDNEPEPNIYNQLDKDQIPIKIEQYMKDCSDKAKEIEEESLHLKEAVRNLQQEKEVLVNQAHEIEGKYNDLT